jgi:hypothetical protein
MRWHKGLLIFLFLGLIACGSEMHQKIKLEIPAYSPLRLDDYKTIVLIPFVLSGEEKKTEAEAEKKGESQEEAKEQVKSRKNLPPPEKPAVEVQKIAQSVDVQGELMAYFATEFGRRFKGQVKLETAPLSSPALIHSPEYWHAWSNQEDPSLVFTGEARFQQEIRKAILYRQEPEEEDLLGPEKGLAARAVFTLELNVALIKLPSGEVVFEKKFKETKTTSDVKYPARFALYELSQRAKLVLFRSIFGEAKPQERYLLIR